jgi:hypothetical protein
MPRRRVPMKDVVHNEKHWSGVCIRKQPMMSEWGNPYDEVIHPQGRAVGELKHLSNPTKREDSASSGERKRNSANRRLRFSGLKDFQQGHKIR